ncbi:hypothetical protein [Amycolatopsis australiensis]|uniref:Uncharacterized protein n=1 Tax=Amycolatopsis australiensis TaxID=546364 RepID=A0A1K1LKW2_9PSEU|nr:hypothetical protein [Amycolatopsis australiensis]SFW11524.1 hypothetical protein SAMN04489730_0028 [Amycolatopsis australiensis]
MTSDAQSAAEVAAGRGEGTAAEFVNAWVNVVLDDRNWALAMGVSTSELRLATAQHFIVRAQQLGVLEVPDDGRDEVAADLASVDTDHPLWNFYATYFLDSFDDVRGRQLAHSTRPRPIDVEHEGVLLIDYASSPGELMTVDGQEMKQLRAEHPPQPQWPLVARRVSHGWLLASFREQLPQPGWPPFLG